MEDYFIGKGENEINLTKYCEYIQYELETAYTLLGKDGNGVAKQAIHYATMAMDKVSAACKDNEKKDILGCCDWIYATLGNAKSPGMNTTRAIDLAKRYVQKIMKICNGPEAQK